MPRFLFPPNNTFYVWTLLNGIRQRLIFDTGSQWVALLQSVIDRLGLQPTNRTTELVTADSKVVGIRRPIYIIPTVEAFGLTVHDVEAVTIDLPRAKKYPTYSFFIRAQVLANLPTGATLRYDSKPAITALISS